MRHMGLGGRLAAGFIVVSALAGPVVAQTNVLLPPTSYTCSYGGARYTGNGYSSNGRVFSHTHADMGVAQSTARTQCQNDALKDGVSPTLLSNVCILNPCTPNRPPSPVVNPTPPVTQPQPQPPKPPPFGSPPNPGNFGRFTPPTNPAMAPERVNKCGAYARAVSGYLWQVNSKFPGCKLPNHFHKTAEVLSFECRTAPKHVFDRIDPNARREIQQAEASCRQQMAKRPPPGRPAGPPPGSGQGKDASRHPVCLGFAQHANRWDGKAIQMGCKFKRAQPSEQAYYRWCQGTSDAEFRVRSPVAAGHKAILEKHCAQQMRRPFRL